jgi:hypothetical protein
MSDDPQAIFIDSAIREMYSNYCAICLHRVPSEAIQASYLIDPSPVGDTQVRTTEISRRAGTKHTTFLSFEEQLISAFYLGYIKRVLSSTAWHVSVAITQLFIIH